MADAPGALAAVAPCLRCPVCDGPVRVGDDRVSCGRGHSFNLARQGYVSLTSGRGVHMTSLLPSGLRSCMRRVTGQFIRKQSSAAMEVACMQGHYRNSF